MNSSSRVVRVISIGLRPKNGVWRMTNEREWRVKEEEMRRRADERRRAVTPYDSMRLAKGRMGGGTKRMSSW